MDPHGFEGDDWRARTGFAWKRLEWKRQAGKDRRRRASYGSDRIGRRGQEPKGGQPPGDERQVRIGVAWSREEAKGLAGAVWTGVIWLRWDCIGRNGIEGLVWTRAAGAASIGWDGKRLDRLGKAGFAAIGCVGLKRSRTMSMRDEIKQLSTEYEARGATLTADDVVRSAQDADKYPDLHDHLWSVSETILAHEARLARAHKLIISIRVVQEEGVESRLYIHTPGIVGYQPLKKVLVTPDLAAARLQQLSADIGRARQRLREFRMLLPSEVADAIDSSLEASERAIVGAAERRQASTGAAA